MTKQIISLAIHVAHQDTPVIVSDADLPGVASGVLAAAQAGKDLYFPAAGEDVPEGSAMFIPFHAIEIITVIRTSTEVEAPADALCQTGETPDPVPGH